MVTGWPLAISPPPSVASRIGLPRCAAAEVAEVQNAPMPLSISTILFCTGAGVTTAAGAAGGGLTVGVTGTGVGAGARGGVAVGPSGTFEKARSLLYVAPPTMIYNPNSPRTGLV